MINEEFFLKISEYNVSIYDRDPVSYIIKNDQIVINGEEIKGDVTDKINRIKNIINSKKEEIETICSSRQSNYKGGRQQLLSIKLNEKKYIIVGNTDNKDGVQLYSDIKEAIKKIINED